jgi:hypothetical protein
MDVKTVKSWNGEVSGQPCRCISQVVLATWHASHVMMLNTQNFLYQRIARPERYFDLKQSILFLQRMFPAWRLMSQSRRALILKVTFVSNNELQIPPLMLLLVGKEPKRGC